MTGLTARIAVGMLGVAALVVGCSSAEPGVAGDADRGRALLRDYGCGGCHQIPGVDGASGNVGPPLSGLHRRVYVAGLLPNAPDTLARWIRSPQKYKPGTAMPDVGASERDAVDMVAYLWRH